MSLSRPVWARGLKLHAYRRSVSNFESRPVWARGLKLYKWRGVNRRKHVASRVGAWIETILTKTIIMKIKVASRVGAWIETVVRQVKNAPCQCRVPCGRVD